VDPEEAAGQPSGGDGGGGGDAAMGEGRPARARASPRR